MSANQGLLGAKTKLSLGLCSWELKWLHGCICVHSPLFRKRSLSPLLRSYRLCLSRSCVNSSCRLALVREISWCWHVLTIRCLLWHLCSLCKIHSVQRKVSKEILHPYMVFWLSWRQGIIQTRPSIFPHMIAEHLCFLVLLSITPPVLCGQSSCPENTLHQFEGVSNVNLNIWHKSLGLQRSAGRWSKGPQWRQGRGKFAKINGKPQLSLS